MVCEKTFKEFLQVCRDERRPQKSGHICLKCFREKKIKRISSSPLSENKLNPLQPCFFDKNKISLIIFQEGHPGINPNKCD